MKRGLSTMAMASVLSVSACGSDESSESGSTTSDEATSTLGMAEETEVDMSGGTGMATAGEGTGDMVMNEPDATPADEVNGEVMTGEFAVLDGAPEGSFAVGGRAWLAQNGDGTTVTVELSGLEPDVEYVSHLHLEVCGEAGGGPHFTFDPDGSDMPPNEVHLGFTADGDGNGKATVTNEQQVGEGAPAIVVHPAEAMDARLACADLL